MKRQNCFSNFVKCSAHGLLILVLVIADGLESSPIAQNDTTGLSQKERIYKFGKSSRTKVVFEKSDIENDEVDRSHHKNETGSLFNDLFHRSVANLNLDNGNGDSDEIESDTEKTGQVGPRLLKCQSCEPNNCDNPYTCYNAVQCWKSRVRDSVGVERIHRGCVEYSEKIPLTCKTSKHLRQSKQAYNETKPDYEFKASYNTVCCSDHDFCNSGEFPPLPPSDMDEHEHFMENETEGVSDVTIALVVAFAIIVFAFLCIVAYFFAALRRTQKKHRPDMHSHQDNFYPLSEGELRAKPAGDSTLKEYCDGSMTSGSGSGLQQLVQRTLAKNVQRLVIIGKGRYGEVWKATWNCENVAVKVFPTMDEASWVRETEIYTTVMMRHECILGFYGSDMISVDSVTQLWLVTQYHRQGSLYDYLNSKTINEKQLLKFAYSIANGLAFLHSEMVGTESRAGIAHRDIKSKNILVTNSDACVIADFGLAVTHKRDTGELNVHPNPKVGTKRFMAPEILDESMNMKSFDAFKRTDMYAFGLVLWEMCRRTTSQGPCEEYQPPFYDVVPSDPSFEDMRKVVCVDGYRPDLPDVWSADPVLSPIIRLIKECWHSRPSVRLSALRVKKSIALNAQDKFKGLLDAAIHYS